jgi:hypothetical protein
MGAYVSMSFVKFLVIHKVIRKNFEKGREVSYTGMTLGPASFRLYSP